MELKETEKRLLEAVSKTQRNSIIVQKLHCCFNKVFLSLTGNPLSNLMVNVYKMISTKKMKLNIRKLMIA